MKFQEKFVEFRIPLIAVLLFTLISFLLYKDYSLGDDTYIYLQYAKNIIYHNQIAFNLGETSYGFTSPLWLSLIVVIGELGLKLTIIPTILSYLFSVLTIIIWYRIIQNLTNNRRLVFLLLTIIIIEPNLLKHTYFGMEATLSFLFSSIIIMILINYKETDQLISKLMIIFSLLILTRPESFLLAFIIIVYLFLNKEVNFYSILRKIYLPILIIGLWIVLSYLYMGSEIIPFTFYSKDGSYKIGARFFMHIADSIKIFFGNYWLHLIFLSIGIIKLSQFKVLKLKLNYLIISIVITYILFYSLILSRELVYARYYMLILPFINFIFIYLILIINKWITQFYFSIIYNYFGFYFSCSKYI